MPDNSKYSIQIIIRERTKTKFVVKPRNADDLHRPMQYNGTAVTSPVLTRSPVIDDSTHDAFASVPQFLFDQLSLTGDICKNNHKQWRRQGVARRGLCPRALAVPRL